MLLSHSKLRTFQVLTVVFTNSHTAIRNSSEQRYGVI